VIASNVDHLPLSWSDRVRPAMAQRVHSSLGSSLVALGPLAQSTVPGVSGFRLEGTGIHS